MTQLSNAKFCTLVDAKKGYWHVPLDEPSSYLTTFGTPFGRFRFTRLPFGLIVSQKQLDSALKGLSGVTGIADDTFVFGSTEQGHDKDLANLIEQARQKGIVFNREKLQLKCKEVRFFGHTWTSQSEARQQQGSSHKKHATPSSHSARLATVTAPLCELTKKDVAYVWGPEHDFAFSAV